MMFEKSVEEFTEELSSSKPVPGGGGACAAVGAFAAALGMMAANLTVGKKRYADVEEDVKKVLVRLKERRDELAALTDKDAKAFEPLSKAYGLPKATEEEKAKKDRIMEGALYEASKVPIEIMETILRAMGELKFLGEKGSRLVVSDVGVGALFAQAALEGASLNVFINTRMMKNRVRAEELEHRAESMIKEGEELKRQIYMDVLSQIR